MKKSRLVPFMLLVLILIWSCAAITNQRTQKGNMNSTDICGSEFDLNQAISHRLSSEDWSENARTAETLLSYANKSTDCRASIIKQLMIAMDKPNLNLLEDRRTHHLWSTGAALLGELKAVEALDLLIAHLDLNDGHFSASGVHQPALFGIRKMGSLAVPKLDLALKHNESKHSPGCRCLPFRHWGGGCEVLSKNGA